MPNQGKNDQLMAFKTPLNAKCTGSALFGRSFSNRSKCFNGELLNNLTDGRSGGGRDR
ncbi:hypothetical protein [Gracilibacillus xinjiangensis]|uniref:Uncharacterized protein n=1 Tax=Gracilibacillus xinjiangensis TaxID=1193282 RepID=A0ABV8WSD3_9BACI